MNAAGTVDLGNATDGITIDANNNTIGTSAAADRNVISGNDDEGVDVHSAGLTGVVIKGNYIGTNAMGTAAVPDGDVSNAQSGGLKLAGDGTIVGGSLPGEGNLVSGNINFGVRILGDSNVVYGNLIGTNAAGTAGIANSGPGVRFE